LSRSTAFPFRLFEHVLEAVSKLSPEGVPEVVRFSKWAAISAAAIGLDPIDVV
jgi:hypothetical protein